MKSVLQKTKTKKDVNKKPDLFFTAVLLLTLFWVPCGYASQESEKQFIELTIQGKKLRVEVARTEKEKSKGLMFRGSLGKEEGMLFVYEKEERLSFWMKNTRIPLSIAFIDKNGKIVDIQDLVPFDLQSRISAFPAQYALEVNQGWFQKNGIAVGDIVKFPVNFKK